MNDMNTATISRNTVLLKVLFRILIAYTFIGLLIFLPAGTFQFYNGWLFMAGLFVPMVFTLIYLMIKDPELLEKRMQMKEKEKEQKIYVKLSMLLYVAAYIIPGLDYRYHWSHVPAWLVLSALIIMLASYIMFIAVMLQNRYASRIIEIQNAQKLIDTGLYTIVRHPMYFSAIFLYLASALVLGSYYALIPMALLPVLLAYRILNEEKVLLTGLPGYDDYCKKVKYRLIPFVW